MNQEDPALDSASTVIGKYDIEECIGRGAMGYVYRARDEVLKRTVALKTIATGMGMGPQDEMLQRFRREARSAAGLNHPNIVTVYDYGEQEGQIYLVMELLDGLDLSEIIKRRLLSTVSDKLGLMKQIAAGVAHAHAAGIMHRDLKPGNVRVLRDGVAKIMDFGLARSHQADLTPTGRLVGTPHYMAPELVRGHPADQRADVFSLGVMFYELLTNHRPFPAPDIHAVLFQILQRQPDPVQRHDPSIPPAFDAVLGKALAKESLERYAHAGELYAALETLDENPSNPPSLPPPATGSSVGHLVSSQVGTTVSMSNVNAAGPETAVTVISSMVRPGAPPSSGGFIEPAEVVYRHENNADHPLTIDNRHTTLLDAALESGINHFHECGGRARCSTCRVRVISGRENLQPRTPQETRLAQRLNWSEDIRLACQARVTGPATVERLVRDTQDVGLLLGEQAQSIPAQEMALAILSAELLEFDPSVGNAPPYDLIHMLNRFFFQIGEPMIQYGGQIQGYTGSGLRVFFGLEGGTAGEKCLAAVRAALRASVRMATFNRYTRTYFSREFYLGIGIHFGRMIVGHFGHPSKRELSTIGSRALSIAVDTSSRNQAGGTTLLATEELVNILEDELRIGHVLVDEVVGGSHRTLYEVVDLAEPEATFAVQRMFELVEARKEEAAATFYDLLFEVAPGVRPLFKNDIRAQGQMLMGTLSAAVHGLDNIEPLLPELRELGKRHLDYGAELAHYEVVGQVLIETVQRILGVEMTNEQRLAWVQVYNQLVGVMTEGLYN